MTITDFSALTLHLPLLDSATLSQAWRDALHVSTRRSTLPPARLAASRVHTPSSVYDQHCRSRVAGRCTAVPEYKPVIAKAVRASSCEQDRTRNRIAVRRDDLQAAHVAPTKHTHEKYIVTLPGGERICVLVRPLQQSLRITILCAPHLQHAMRCALAILAGTLASSSIALDVATFAKGV